MAKGRALVLTFHSISDEGGPTSIPPRDFERQMRGLADLGYGSATLEQFIAWLDGADEAMDRRVLITFDDGFRDFKDTAWTILDDLGFSALVFLPTGKLGGVDDWPGGGRRALMTWDEIGELADFGVQFGAHGVHHLDLTGLEADARAREISDSGREIERRLGGEVRAFAPPYGRSNRHVRDDIGRRYAVAFGTRLAHASRSSDRLDLPRIEMHYFRDLERWRDFLQGGTTYFHGRRALRAVRERMFSALPRNRSG